MSDPPYDPVLDQHIRGGGPAKQHVYRVFRDQSVRFMVVGDTEDHHLDFPVQAFHWEDPWASQTTSEPVNVTLRYAEAGGLTNGAIAHGWIHPRHYLEFWGAATNLAFSDPTLPIGRDMEGEDHWDYIQNLLTSAIRGEPPDEVLDIYDVWQTNPRALRTPYIRLTHDGDLAWDSDGLKRAAMLVYDWAERPDRSRADQRLMPVYIATAGTSTEDREGNSTLPTNKEGNQ